MRETLARLGRRAAAIAILAAVLAGAYMGVARPIWQQFVTHEESIARNVELIERFNSVVVDPTALEELKATAAKSDPGQADILRGSNDAVAAAFIQQFVSSAVEAEGGAMRSVQILPAADQDGFRRVSIRAQMTLTTAALRGVLYRIETSQPFMFINNLDVRQGPQVQMSADATSETPLLVRVDVYGFIRPPAPQIQGS